MSRRARPFLGGLLLGIVILLNLAAVLPALHHLWHADHECEETECAVALFAAGQVTTDDPVAPLSRPEVTVSVSPSVPVLPQVAAADCPPVPGRAPPV